MSNSLNSKPPLTLGIYQGLNGACYHVLDLAKHTETYDWYVVLRNQRRELWVIPFTEFSEPVEHEEGHIPKFRLIFELSPSESCALNVTDYVPGLRRAAQYLRERADAIRAKENTASFWMAQIFQDEAETIEKLTNPNVKS